MSSSENESEMNESEDNQSQTNESDVASDDSDSEEKPDSDSSNDDERTQIRGELSNMPFEELMKLKQQLGAKVYNEAIFGKTIETKRPTKAIIKRQNNNRPMEMGAKRPVPFGINLQTKKPTVIRDPRFDPNCGTYDSSKFKERYEFVNDMRDNELTELKEKLKAAKDPDEEKKLKFLIQRMDNQLKEETKRKQKVEQFKEEDKTKKIAKAEGKTPFYKKDSHRRAEDLVKQYLELKSAGKLEKHLEKRRKKIKTQHRKKFNFD